jgi:7,8-didemethyl-8-hydroxy-5-deazariboflavin synthase CofH subunit
MRMVMSEVRNFKEPEIDYFLAGIDAVERLLGSINPENARPIERALSGKELTFEDGLRLAHSSGRELQALIGAADKIRQDTVGDVITYVINRNINFTNVCFVGCQFCAFSRAPREPGAFFLSLEEISRRAAEASARGATEVCVQGGLPHEMDGYHYREVIRAVKRGAPSIHIHAFSPMEVIFGVEKTGLPLADYLLMLQEAGLGTMPGTAAEILDDAVRERISSQKLTVNKWVEVITTAHRLGIRSTSTMMYGHVEQPVHWVRHLLLLRKIQEQTRGFTEFVPLGFVHFNTRLYRSGRARPGPTVEEHLKVHALARLMLRGRIENIQVSWVKLGIDLSQACLMAGANDYGGTLMEENISRLAGATAGQYMSPEQFHSQIVSLKRIPAERSTTYERVKLN